MGKSYDNLQVNSSNDAIFSNQDIKMTKLEPKIGKTSLITGAESQEVVLNSPRTDNIQSAELPK